jgi:tyrosyl-DNA phosphodiesterase-1
MKLQSAAQQKQLQYMRPHLCLWAGDRSNSSSHNQGGSSSAVVEKREAGRRRAAPHIKTYIQFSDQEKMDEIDWAMVTSANLSTQAWGAAPSTASGEVRICSWEIGVVVWPQLFIASEEGRDVAMVPCFKQDLPVSYPVSTGSGEEGKSSSTQTAPILVGFRMPYDLPLTPYKADDIPWCATASHTEPDWLGQTWNE